MICGVMIADDEIPADYISSRTLYFVRFQSNGDVFLADGLTNEIWGTGGRDADDYDIPMIESGNSGHYVGDFDTPTNISAGEYDIAVYEQIGGSPADSDQPALFWGAIRWTGAAEDKQVIQSELTAHDAKLDIVDDYLDSEVADILSDTGELQSNQDNWATAVGFSTAANLATHDGKLDGVLEDTGTTLNALLVWIQNWLEADEIISDSDPAQYQVIRTVKQSGGGGAEIGRKDVNDIDGNPITDLQTVFSQSVEP